MFQHHCALYGGDNLQFQPGSPAHTKARGHAPVVSRKVPELVSQHEVGVDRTGKEGRGVGQRWGWVVAGKGCIGGSNSTSICSPFPASVHLPSPLGLAPEKLLALVQLDQS